MFQLLHLHYSIKKGGKWNRSSSCLDNKWHSCAGKRLVSARKSDIHQSDWRSCLTEWNDVTRPFHQWTCLTSDESSASITLSAADTGFYSGIFSGQLIGYWFNKSMMLFSEGDHVYIYNYMLSFAAFILTCPQICRCRMCREIKNKYLTSI